MGAHRYQGAPLTIPVLEVRLPGRRRSFQAECVLGGQSYTSGTASLAGEVPKASDPHTWHQFSDFGCPVSDILIRKSGSIAVMSSAAGKSGVPFSGGEVWPDTLVRKTCSCDLCSRYLHRLQACSSRLLRVTTDRENWVWHLCLHALSWPYILQVHPPSFLHYFPLMFKKSLF